MDNREVDNRTNEALTMGTEDHLMSSTSQDAFLKSGRSVYMHVNLDNVSNNIKVIRSVCKNKHAGMYTPTILSTLNRLPIREQKHKR